MAGRTNPQPFFWEPRPSRRRAGRWVAAITSSELGLGDEDTAKAIPLRVAAVRQPPPLHRNCYLVAPRLREARYAASCFACPF